MSKTILIIDDDFAARRMMKRVLERKNYEVVEANDGRSGLDIAKAETPEIILLDLRMPGEFSGFDVAQKLKNDQATSSIPIIIVSASTQTEARELVSKIGCEAFLEKPVDFDELYEVLASVTSLKNQ